MQRLGFHKITWAKLISAGMCMIALSVFLTVSPRPAKAQPGGGCGPCVDGVGSYSQGKCHDGQRCACGGTVAAPEAYWVDDDTCPCPPGRYGCIL